MLVGRTLHHNDAGQPGAVTYQRLRQAPRCKEELYGLICLSLTTKEATISSRLFQWVLFMDRLDIQDLCIATLFSSTCTDRMKAAQSVSSTAFEVCRVLLRNGAHLGNRDSHGRTVLHIAARCDAAATVEVLIEAGIDVKSVDNDGETALHHATSRSDVPTDLIQCPMGQANLSDLGRRVPDSGTATHESPTPAYEGESARLDACETSLERQDISSKNGLSTRQEPLLPPEVEQAGAPLQWLSSPDLPDAKHVKVLVDYYFQNFHPLRCFSFIHKPSFLQKLDYRLASDPGNDALLHIMCTLGAQFFTLEYSDSIQPLPTSFVLKAGSQWAKRSQRLLLDNTSQISIHGLMTAQLLYDYALRMADFTQAFVLSALMARMTQALQINIEYSSNILDQSSNASLSATDRECRRRLMWSCYITDVLCSNGVEQLTLISEKHLKIQLPCNDWSFLHEQPCITRTLNGSPLDFIPCSIIPIDIDSNMGMLAYLIRVLEIRRRVLWYIKNLDQAMLPWLPDSEFAQLDQELQTWYASLPSNLRFEASAIYLRKETWQLGALCFLHCAYHQTMLDFYRIGTPELFKLRSPFHFSSAGNDFQRHLQYALFKEARTLAAIIAETEQHGSRMIGDTWFPTIAYESNRVMLFYLTQIADPLAANKRDLVLTTIPYLQSNLKALKTMRATSALADSL
ncbi:hypothetical protein FZEAL_10729, partial [Fusarium zealandicum]